MAIIVRNNIRAPPHAPTSSSNFTVDATMPHTIHHTISIYLNIAVVSDGTIV